MKQSQTNLLVWFFMLVVSALPSVRNASGQPSSPQDVNMQMIESVGPVYYVSVFGGNFPIPTTYEFFPSPHETPGHFEFRSPAIPLIGTREGLSPRNVGSITIGSYRNYLKKYGNHYLAQSSTQTTKCYGLTILITPATASKLQHLGYKTVFIHNNDQYIEIGAVNGGLWKELLRRFGKTVKKPPGQDCRI